MNIYGKWNGGNLIATRHYNFLVFFFKIFLRILPNKDKPRLLFINLYLIVLTNHK